MKAWSLEDDASWLELSSSHAELSRVLHDLFVAVDRLLRVSRRIERTCEEHCDVRYMVGRWLGRLTDLLNHR